MKKDIVIVILNWNGQKMLAQYLRTVENFSRTEADIVIADNASTDNSIDYLRHNHPNIRIIAFDKNWGFAEGYNLALQQLKDYKYYVLLNSDVKVTHHWLTPLVEFMDAHEEVAACQPKLLAMSNPDMFEYAGAAGGFLDKYGYPFCRGRIFDTTEMDTGQYNQNLNILWATGACLMIKSAAYWEAGGLDARFFAHSEEIDLCWRLRLLGMKIFCITDSIVYHVGGGTLPKGNPMKTFLNFRNNLTMLYKNLPDHELKHVMRIRFFLDYIAAFSTLILNQNFKDFQAILKARRAFKKWIPLFENDRKLIQESRKEKHIPERKGYSILWQYYVKKRRSFKDISKSRLIESIRI